MKAQVRVSPTVLIEIEGEKQVDLFKAIASAHEVFGEKKCGLCGSTDIAPVVRSVTSMKNPRKPETFQLCEYHCQGTLGDGKRCGAKLRLGELNDKTGTLYPVRRLLPNGKTPGKDDGDKAAYGTHRGWSRYKGKPEEDGPSDASS